MTASMSLPVGESSACSVMETTRTPLRRSMDLKATACSRLRVNLENFQTRLSDICIFIAKLGSFRAVIELAYTNPYTMARPVHNKETASVDATGAAVSGVGVPRSKGQPLGRCYERHLRGQAAGPCAVAPTPGIIWYANRPGTLRTDVGRLVRRNGRGGSSRSLCVSRPRR